MIKTNVWDLTPYQGTGKYDSCERAVADLRIYYDEGTHEEITRILGVNPKNAHNKGDVWCNLRGDEMLRKYTLWSLDTESSVESMDLRDHLDLLLSRLNGKIEELQKLDGLKMGIHCIWWSKGSGGPSLTSHQMKRLGELGLECSFEISFFGEDE